MSDADGEHDLARRETFAIVEAESEALGQALQAGDHSVFEFRNFAFFEGLPVGRESIESNRNTGVRVFDFSLGAEMPESEVAVRIVDTRGESIRLEMHAFRHVRLPAIHEAAEDAEWNAQTTEVGSDGKSVRTCANDCSFKHDYEVP